jgi:hypothetical protein
MINGSRFALENGFQAVFVGQDLFPLQQEKDASYGNSGSFVGFLGWRLVLRDDLKLRLAPVQKRVPTNAPINNYRIQLSCLSCSVRQKQSAKTQQHAARRFRDQFNLHPCNNPFGVVLSRTKGN